MPTVAPPKRKESAVEQVMPDDGFGGASGWDAQVVLFNDDVNDIEDVIAWLMEIFGHGEQIATGIALEAHTRGRAIAEVEPRAEAEQHAAALLAKGLQAAVESIG